MMQLNNRRQAWVAANIMAQVSADTLNTPIRRHAFSRLLPIPLAEDAIVRLAVQSFEILQPGDSLDSSPMHMYELLIDLPRPSRWTACEEKLKQLIANVSLRELDLLL
jgi:hypothetical protein